MNEIKSNEWFNGKLSYSSYLNVINVYIKFMKNFTLSCYINNSYYKLNQRSTFHTFLFLINL